MKCLALTRGSAGSLCAEKDKVEPPVVLKGQTAPLSTNGSGQVTPAVSCPTEEHLKGPHNKENCREKRCSADLPSDDEVILSSSSLAEDSGYLSLHNSQIEHVDTAESSERCAEQRDSTVSSGTHSDSNSSCLPVLKFQEEVCKALANSYRKSQSYDWTVVDRIAELHGLQNVIGGKMGLEHVDILCGLLQKDMKHILTRILGLLGESDLISCKRVSKTWRKIICQDDRALQRCRNAEKMRRDSGRSMGSLSRDFCLSRVVLSCLQTRVTSSTPVHKAKKALTQTDSTVATPKTGRFAEFHEATKSLKSHESLRSCRLCGSPARFDSAMQRAVCMRISCAFEFCSQCQSAYHGSAPCQRGMIRASPRSQTVPVAGSARSKRSIRRL
ncbi:F-box only protein 5 [Colossoma macropomum]|uniref:F-box only protein 5 n=1 Tax=Colossoma macropomum TaxID=42526 RepID=UPI0018648C6E|nr:F-box only protein 5 [Colossoma macropomum]